MTETVYTLEKREDPEVRRKINLCEDLKGKLEGYRDAMVEHRNTASASSETCQNIVNVETENLSGIYYEDKYLPYRDTEFEKISTLHSGANTMISSIEAIIQKIQEALDDLYEHLMIEVWVPHTIYLT